MERVPDRIDATRRRRDFGTIVAAVARRSESRTPRPRWDCGFRRSCRGARAAAGAACQ